MSGLTESTTSEKQNIEGEDLGVKVNALMDSGSQLTCPYFKVNREIRKTIS